MQEIHLTSGIPFCFHKYPFWVYDIPFWFVKEMIIGSIRIFMKSYQVSINPSWNLYNTKSVFQETSKGLNKIPVWFYVKPTKSKMKYQLGFMQNQSQWFFEKPSIFGFSEYPNWFGIGDKPKNQFWFFIQLIVFVCIAYFQRIKSLMQQISLGHSEDRTLMRTFKGQNVIRTY